MYYINNFYFLDLPYVTDIRPFCYISYFRILVPWCRQRRFDNAQQHSFRVRYQSFFGLHRSDGRHRVL